jgi:hypothetical protein
MLEVEEAYNRELALLPSEGADLDALALQWACDDVVPRGVKQVVFFLSTVA